MNIRKALENYPDMLQVKHLERILGLKACTIYIWLRQGKIRGFKLGQEWRVAKEELIAYLEDCQSRTPRHG